MLAPLLHSTASVCMLRRDTFRVGRVRLLLTFGRLDGLTTTTKYRYEKGAPRCENTVSHQGCRDNEFHYTSSPQWTFHMLDLHETDDNGDDDIRPFEWLTSPASLRGILTSWHDEAQQPPYGRRAIHIGSGSSTVGEFLVNELGYDLVLDVDKDEEALIRMRKRWTNSCAARTRTTTTTTTTTNPDPSRLQHVLVDFTQEQIPQAPDASFGLIVDKGTLDCSLCSDNGTAHLLAEMYRCLSVGGRYVVISLHEQELLFPLLSDLPGAQWDVSCHTMARQVERLDGGSALPPTKVVTDEVEGKSSQQHPPLSVLIARKRDIRPTEDCHSLKVEEIGDHVRRINDVWFQQSRPLLNAQRTEELRTTFVQALPPPEAYQYLFTEAEREDLSYDFFLEDWHAFVALREMNQDAFITFDLAVDFLTVMQ